MEIQRRPTPSKRHLTYPWGVCYLSNVRKGVCHHDQLMLLRRIEGQVRGVQRMIEGQRYCVDILNAIGAIRGALRKVEATILKDHLNACVKYAFNGRSRREKDVKLKEIFGLLEGLRK